MFGTVADLITLLSTTLFPLFAAYKALKDPTPATLAPWLVYYATLSLVNLVESTLLYPFTFLPLYAWLRLLVHLYLLLPAPQGAPRVYEDYIEPFISQHEAEIEDFISQAHDRVKATGLLYIRHAIEWIRITVLGQEPHPPTPPPPSYGSYAQQLLSRFYGPSTTVSTASAGATTAHNEFYSAVLSVLQPTLSGRTATVNRTADASLSLIPEELSSPGDRLNYVQQAQEGLKALMQAFEKEKGELAEEKEATPLSKSRSEADFDKIERSEVSFDRSKTPKRSPSGGWMPWNWATSDDAAAAQAKKDEGPVADVPTEGKSSGIDLG